mmetsp:Transcript_8830/g.7809  ORF Transcript_8830/g.7809 Transcript_8830/m.7809 type:complete len:92 (-) Transcript_8830:413-688(-)
MYKGEFGSKIYRKSMRQLKATMTVVNPNFERKSKRTRTALKDMFTKKKYRKAAAYGCLLSGLVQFSGYMYIINYATSIFKQSSPDPEDRTP